MNANDLNDLLGLDDAPAGGAEVITAAGNSDGGDPAVPVSPTAGYFGAWLSGFTDGEGTFILSIVGRRGVANSVRYSAYFGIRLRADDRAVLEKIKGYFGCGFLRAMKTKPPAQLQWKFSVERTPDLVRAVLPHFDRYPLQAKKARDYLIWREGVLQLYEVWQRRPKRNGTPHGFLPKWLDEEVARFTLLRDTLNEQRKYKEPSE
jgi:hypothetical protein